MKYILLVIFAASRGGSFSGVEFDNEPACLHAIEQISQLRDGRIDVMFCVPKG